MVVLTLKTISHCLLDLEKNWNLQIKHLKQQYANAQNEIVSLKTQLETKEKLLKAYEDRETEALSLPPLQNDHALPQNAYQPILMAPQNPHPAGSRSNSPQVLLMEEVKQENTMEIKQEANEGIDVTSIASASPTQQVILVSSPVAPVQSMTVAPVEAPVNMTASRGIPESLNQSKKRPRIDNDHDDEIPLDIVLRESHQQKQNVSNKLPDKMAIQPSTSGAPETPSRGQRNYRQLAPKDSSNNVTAVVLTHHQPGLSGPPRPKSPIMLDLKCTICMARCKNLHEYRVHHRAAHPKSKSILCDRCPYATINKMNFSHHVQTHDEYVGHPDAQRCRGGCDLYFITSRAHNAHLHKYHYMKLTNIEQQFSQ